MSDLAILFALDNLKQIVVCNANSIMNVRGEVKNLLSDLAMFKAFVEESMEKSTKHKVVKKLLQSIRGLTYEVEDAIDAFVVEATDHKSKKWTQKVFGAFDHTYKLRQVAKKVESLRANVSEIYDNPIFGYGAREGGDSSTQRRMEKKIPDVEKDIVVGFDEATVTLIDLLTRESEDLQVISIIGMSGLGKTTLAYKVYNNPRILHEFSTRSWIYVSQTYSKKELFLSILKGVTQVTYKMSNMSDDELAEEVRNNLTWKYLIVVDDVWEKEDWDSIKNAFPNIRNGSRILLTSRNKAVMKHANLCSLHYKLDFLTDQQSWELLRIKVFGSKVPEEHHDLMDIGMRIALECGGLPLAIVVIAGILQTKRQKDWWEIVANSVNTFPVRDDEYFIKVLALSYHHLPPYLKACFLYFGVFPEDYEIPVWILIRLWIAEGFVQKIGNACLEEMAEEHLEDLAARNLVLVVQRSFNGRIKTCRIHDMLRNLCLEKAQEESFLSEIMIKEDGTGLNPAVSNDNRRICIHSHVFKYISTKPSGSHVRSFLCFSKDQIKLPRTHVAYIPEEFKLLRVYHIQPIRCPRFPSEIEKLVYLKYVAFSGDFKTIPAAMSKLWNLETLIVETSSRTIDIQADILNMLQLRHLHTNGASQLRGPVAQKDKDGDNAIQTLSTITPESCTKGVLGKTPCIKKLGIRGKLATLLENSGSLFDNLTNLQQLVTLKLLNDTFPHPPSESKLPCLPSWGKFPQNLKRLTLADTFLDWKHMSVLEMLLELEELKLKDNAFTGVRWCPDRGFKKLKALQIWKTDLVYWDTKADHFPSLQHIVLKDCMKLWAVPSSLGTLKTLLTIKLHQTSRAAANSAREIKQHQQESKVYNGLKVDIFPSDL